MDKNFTNLIKEAQDLRDTDPKQALNMLNNALGIAYNESAENHLVEILFELGVTYHNLSNHREAAVQFKKALDIPAIEDDLFLKANILRCLSVQLIRANNIENAVNYLYESEKVSTECGFDENLHMVESTFGSLYIQLKMFDKALEHEIKSLKIAEKLNLPGTKGYSYLGIGSCYYLINDYENAAIYLNKVFEDTNTNFTLANTYYYLSKLYLALNQYDKALDSAMKGHKIATDNHINDYAAICLGMIGKINISLGNYLPAIKYINEAISIAENFENKRIYFALYKDLIQAYGKTRDYKNQAAAYEKLYSYHTEYLEEQSRLKIKQLNTEHQVDKAKDDAEIQRLRNVELKKVLDEVNKLNTKLEELNEEKNDFMSIAVHDLKNPLQNILSTARIIKATNSNKELHDFADNIVLQTDRMFSLIRKLLDHSAIEEGNIKIRKTEFKADTICREILNDYNGAASKKNQIINFENQCNGDKLYTDYDILYQIMGNIVSNAVKFSHENKNINLKSYTNNGHIVFEIQDEGPGFTEADKKKVFRKFARLSAIPTNGENSTGLGLSIAKKLSEIINADIQLESHEGKGSSFKILVDSV